MTLSISDNTLNVHNPVKRIIIWSGISVFCVIFFLIYDRFSHNVRSYYMTYLFVLPLIFGVLPEIIIYVLNILSKRKPVIGRFSDNAYCSGVAAIMAGSLIKGILDIAGAASVYQKYLFYAGIIFMAAAVVEGIFCNIINKF